MFQNEDTSSIENSSPPTGAPKAEATPAAAPAEMKLRLFDRLTLCQLLIASICPHVHFILVKIQLQIQGEQFS